MTSTETGDQTGNEDIHEQLSSDYFVQSPDGNIYPADAQGRSDLVARGYTDITDFGGAEKFREQNEAAGQTTTATEQPAESKPAEQPARQAPAQGRRQPTEQQPGPAAQNAEDAANGTGRA